jgi:ligand-binding sensor domain-containing protein
VVGDRDQIWVASNEGVTVSAGSDSAFYDAANSELLADRVLALAAAPDGVVWLGGEGALYRVDGDDWTVYTAESTADSNGESTAVSDGGDFPAGPIVDLALAEDGALWLGSAAAEVCRFDPAAGRCAEFYSPEITEGMAAGPLTSLTVDAGGTVYYTTAGNGYAVLEDGAWRTAAVRTPRLRGNAVQALARDAGGSLWAATNAGVQRIAAQGVPELFVAEDVGMAVEDVRALAEEPDGGVWVGGRNAAGAAASLLDGESWRRLTAEDGLAGNIVQAIVVDGEGRTWLGSDAGISVWNGSSFFVIDREQGLPSDDIRALAADESGVWIGTAGGGLYRFANSQLQLLNRENVGLPSDDIRALAVGPDGALWIGADQGLARLADGELTPIEELSARAVTGLAVTEDGNIWAATGDGALFYGVYEGENGGWLELTAADPRPGPQIAALLADGPNVWLGGAAGGIMRFDRQDE